METYGRFPLVLDRGEGVWVWDDQGHRYLDCVAGIATCTLGHAHPHLVAAVTQQMQRLHHVSNLYYIPQQGRLAQWLTQHSCADKVFFCNSGAEANEAAIKLARKYGHHVLKVDQPVILTAHSSFHGRTLATITATGQPKYQRGFSPLVPGFAYIPYNDFQALEQAVADLNQGPQRVVAILLEPLQGEGGVNPGDRDYFQALRKLCDQNQMLLILDEVQTGMGRTGQYWGYENLGIEPDIFTLAKGLAGGIPIGAMLCRSTCDVFEPGDHASTFGGNPLACASALAVCEYLEAEHIPYHAEQMGALLHQELAALTSQYPEHFQRVRGWGLMKGLVISPESRLTAIEVVKAALQEGLLIVPAGPKVLRFVPPLIIQAHEIHEAIARLKRAIASL
ncbi:aspartate aminotransferase family protein [Lyngbya confervoides BDU141951]|uniref:Acetylornithine aminotransferase n=2 Tax=Lyngbya TaxID=28073 RepID=A0ABD4T4J8_9CYAN|nr:aspartate aminotransferase family protein [Lyngbya confervoides]MCM1983452.1 aspartate aminotransferase family protein [Lyngbya confervoides BDU141951]